MRDVGRIGASAGVLAAGTLMRLGPDPPSLSVGTGGAGASLVSSLRGPEACAVETEDLRGGLEVVAAADASLTVIGASSFVEDKEDTVLERGSFLVRFTMRRAGTRAGGAMDVRRPPGICGVATAGLTTGRDEAAGAVKTGARTVAVETGSISLSQHGIEGAYVHTYRAKAHAILQVKQPRLLAIHLLMQEHRSESQAARGPAESSVPQEAKVTWE